MSYTAQEFSQDAKKLLQLLLQKYRGKTLHQSLWGEISGIRSCGSHSELRKLQNVEEEDICLVSTNNLSIVLLARWHSHCILNDGMYAETLKIHPPKPSEVSSSLALTVSQWSFLQFLCFSNTFNPPILLFTVFSFLLPFKLKHT